MNNGGISINRNQNELLYLVYGWMTLGLLITGIVSFYIARIPAITNVLFKNTGLLIVLFLLQIGLVFGLSFFINRMSASIAILSFLVYSFLNGITLSGIFLIYTHSSIATTFLVAAGMFAVMALYGFFTKTDLSGMGSILSMALIGLIIALIANLFLKSNSFDYIISAIGVIIFSLLTAYDVQQIKDISTKLVSQNESILKASIIGALKLYLDFINLFLFLLRFFGKKHES